MAGILCCMSTHGGHVGQYLICHTVGIGQLRLHLLAQLPDHKQLAFRLMHFANLSAQSLRVFLLNFKSWVDYGCVCSCRTQRKSWLYE